MGVELIHDQHDLFSVGIDLIDQVLDHMREIHHTAVIRDGHFAPAAQRLAQHEHGGHAAPVVLVVEAGWSPRCGRQWCACFGHQLLAGLIQTHLRTTRLVRSGVDVQDVFHVPDELATRRTRQAPVFFQPGLEIVFFSVRRTVSYYTASTMSNSTALSASRRSVQRLRPSGGGLQATAIRRASWALSSLRRCRVRDRRGRSAASGPSSTHRVRTRSTVERLTSSASTIWSSFQAVPPGPASALSRIRACIRVRAAALPTRTNSSRYPRSSPNSRTW